MSMVLVENQPLPYNELLRPLKFNFPVALLVRDTAPKKKRIGEPILFITPTRVYGSDDNNLVFALEGQGCEVMPRDKVKLIYLSRIGLSMQSAKLLKTELEKLYKDTEVIYGN